MNGVCVGSIVHYVVTDGGGKRCCGAMVTAVANPTDAYRDHDHVGLRAWSDTDEIIRPLPLGGSRYDPGAASDAAVWACDGLDHEGGTWHHISMLHYSGTANNDHIQSGVHGGAGRAGDAADRLGLLTPEAQVVRPGAHRTHGDPDRAA